MKHCNITENHFNTIHEVHFCFYTQHNTPLTSLLKVSWMRLDNKTTEPSLLAVGQFVFTKDKRVGVTVQPAISRYSLTIAVSNPRLITIHSLIETIVLVSSEQPRVRLRTLRVPGQHGAPYRSHNAPLGPR